MISHSAAVKRFFGLLFFAQAKKGNSPKAKASAFIAKGPKSKSNVPG
ncbi:hypothetical protein [[Pseudomonas] boreopolis]